MSGVGHAIKKGAKIIGGVVLGTVGVLTSQAWLVQAGIMLTLSGTADLLSEPGSSPTAQELERGRTVNVLSNEAIVPVVYGRTKLAVEIVDIRLDPADSDVLYVVAAFALGSEDGSGIEEVEAIYFDERLAIDAPVFESEPATTGVRSPYAGKLEYGLHAGADAQAVDAMLDTAFSEYSASTAGRGIAYVALKLTYDPNVYVSGVPNITAIVKGRKVYDPRSGLWAWSDSPALCILDYLASKRIGTGALYSERDGGSTSEIDEQSFIDAANYHDDVISMGPGTGTRFTCNGRLETGKTHDRNLAELLACCRGDLVYEAGKFRLITPQVQTAETFELTPDNIIGEVQYWRGGTEQVPNRITMHYLDEDNEWTPQEVTWPEPADTNAFLSADNDFENVLEVTSPFTVGHYRAQQIGMVLLREAREDTGVALTATEEALKLRVDDVVRVTWPRAGFDQAEFRVKTIALNPDETVRLALAEYDSAAYTLDAQNTRDTLPASSLPDVTSIAAPTALTFASGDSTVLVTQGGAIIPRILFGWTPPSDSFLDHYDVQIKLSSDSTWRDAGRPIAGDASLYIQGVVEGEDYDVQIRAANTLGVVSSWVQLTNQTLATHSVLPLPQNVNDVVQSINGDFEAGLAYWGGGLDGTEISLETSSPISGAKSLKLTKAGASNIDVYQVTDARDVGKTAASRWLYLKVQPGDQVRLRLAYKTDGTMSARMGIREFDADKSPVAWQTTSLSATATALTADQVYMVPSGVYYVSIFLSTTTAATTGYVIFDDIAIERLVDADSAQDPFDLTAHSVKFDLGTIGGWDMDATTISAGGASGVVLDSSVPSITLGGAGGIVLDGSVPSIEIGGASGIVLNATAPSLSIGGASGPLTGAGVWAGIDGGAADWRAGDPAGQYVHWDGSAGLLTLQGQIVYAANFAGSAQIGWEALVRRALNGARNLLFNGDFEDGDNFWSTPSQVSFPTDSTKAHTGNRYALLTSTGGANVNFQHITDEGTARYYPVAEGDVVEIRGWVYRETGGKSCGIVMDALDKDKLHVAYAQENYDGTNGVWAELSAQYTVPSGVKYIRSYCQIYDVVDMTDTTVRFDDLQLKILVQAGDIVANTITAAEIGSLVFTGKTANFDTGTVGGWTMASGQLSAGGSAGVRIDATNKRILMGPATAPLTGAGIFAGLDGSDWEFRAGDPAGEHIHFDGTTFTIAASTFTAVSATFENGLSVQNGTGGDRHQFVSDVNDNAVYKMYDGGGSLAFSISAPTPTAPGNVRVRLVSSGYPLDIDPNGNALMLGGIGWGPWHKDSSTRSHTGDTSETTIVTATVPADLLGTDGGVWLRVWGLIPSSGGSLRVKFGGSNFAQFTGLSAGTFMLYVEIHNQGSTSSQQCWAHLHSANGATGRIERSTAFTKDTTSDQDVVISFQLSSASNTFTINHSVGEYLPIAA